MTSAGLTPAPREKRIGAAADAGFGPPRMMTAANKAAARDPMAAGGELLKGIGAPPAKGG